MLISQAEFEQRIGRSLTSEELVTFTTMNSANQAYVERKIGSKLEAVGSSVKYYDGGVQHLKINPCTSITKVEQIDDGMNSIYVYDPEELSLDPINSVMKTQIRHRSRFSTGINNIAVTAKFSIYEDSDVLAIVKNALLDSLETMFEDEDDVRSESIEGYSVTYSAKTNDGLDSIDYLFGI